MRTISFLFSLLLICFVSCNHEEIVLKSYSDAQNVSEEGVKLYAQKETSIKTRGVGLTDKFWNPGQTIRIKFLNGTETQKSKVMEFSQEWTDYANLNFDFVEASESADVKIAFDWQGDRVTWSHIGTDAKITPQNVPSLNFGNLSSLDRFIKRDVLMQFGHVLGLVNEHQGVNNPVEFDTELVYEYYLAEGWSVLEITNFFFKPYSSAITNYTDYDSKSIMVWPIDEIFTTNGMGQLRNSELSEMDKEFIAQIYPADNEDFRYTILRFNSEEEFTIDLKTALNTSEYVSIDFGNGTQFEGLGTDIPMLSYAPGEYEVKIEAERISLQFSEYLGGVLPGGKALKYIKLNGITEYEYIIFKLTGLEEIECDPNNAPLFKQTDFNQAFQSTLIKTIPENLFYNCSQAINMSSVFSRCVNLERIPENLFKNLTQVNQFTSCFSYCSNLLEIPENLFQNCTELLSLGSVFSGCTALIEIPEKLFHYTPKNTNFSDSFKSCTSLIRIPEKLFAFSTHAVSFYGCFQQCINITEIPKDLFINCPEVTGFGNLFYSCSSLAEIPEGLFSNCPKVTNFSGCFTNCISLIELPDGIFKNNPKVTNFRGCFSGCTSLRTLPEDLFENCTEVTTFQTCFNGCRSLLAIPENLFKDCAKVISFFQTFASCESLEDIPEHLFQACTEIKQMDYCFYGCSSLTHIPERLFENNNKINYFNLCFTKCINLTGDAPRLWEKPYVLGGSSCFSQCYNLDNYREIPSDWK